MKSKEWINGEQLITQSGITSFILIDWIKDGLQAYSESGDKIYDIDSVTSGPTEEERTEARHRWTIDKMSRERGQGGTSDNISKFPNGYHGIETSIPRDENEKEKYFKELLGFYFKKEDVREFKERIKRKIKDEESDKDLSSDPTIEEALRIQGRKYAKQGWEWLEDLKREAAAIAKKEYENGSGLLHNKMTDWIIDKSQFQKIKERRYRKAILAAVKEVAYEYDKVKGDREGKK